MPIKESKGAKASEAELRANIESYLKSFLDEQSIENDQKEIDFEQTKFINKIIERVLKGTR